MKKLLLLVLFLFPTLASAQTVSFQNNLSYGSTGSDVSALQEFLVTQHLLAPQYVTGSFYSLTLAAVKSFQTAESISPVSGFVGPITRNTINTILAQETPQSEESAATTTEPVDLSQSTTTPVYTPPQVIYVPIQQSTQTFGNTQIIPQTPSCVDTPVLSAISTSTNIDGENQGLAWQGTFSDICPLLATTKVTFGFQKENGTVIDSQSDSLAEVTDWNGFNTISGGHQNILTGQAIILSENIDTSNGITFRSDRGSDTPLLSGPWFLSNIDGNWSLSTTTPLYAFISIDGITQTIQVQ